MSILHRIVDRIFPPVATIEEFDRHFDPESDPHMQWLNGQRLESESKVRDMTGQLPNVVEEAFLPYLMRERKASHGRR